MNEINTILLCCCSQLDANSLRHLILISEAVLSMTGRMMLGIIRNFSALFLTDLQVIFPT